MCFLKQFYAKYTKLNSISRPTVIKYLDLVTIVVWKNHFSKFRKTIDGYKYGSQFKKCRNKIFVRTKSTILPNVFSIFIVSQQQINILISLQNNLFKYSILHPWIQNDAMVSPLEQYHRGATGACSNSSYLVPRSGFRWQNYYSVQTEAE